MPEHVTFFDQWLDTILRVPNLDEQNNIAAIVLSFGVGVDLTPEQSLRFRRWLSMMPVVREIEQEAEKTGRMSVAKAMLADDMDVERIMRYTDLSAEEVESLRKELSN